MSATSSKVLSGDEIAFHLLELGDEDITAERVAEITARLSRRPVSAHADESAVRLAVDAARRAIDTGSGNDAEDEAVIALDRSTRALHLQTRLIAIKTGSLPIEQRAHVVVYTGFIADTVAGRLDAPAHELDAGLDDVAEFCHLAEAYASAQAA
ncbi:hypothetical protein [Burkholderia vietnamiensis]|uniref:hypothetical protein n=1 Tax=Burkholderia vietnamiensis TaxID=60552 RepID=UPI001CF5066C|nr:hypothetical protein [Burkholderia vietnamiensis]MCA8228298.1 hypothetical protein [Burkholderia vietnamiensis]